MSRAVVLEDDVAADADLPHLLDTFDAWTPDDCVLTYLAHHMAEPIIERQLQAHGGVARSLCTFSTPVMSSAAYVITAHAAEELLRRAFPLRMPIDDLLGRPEHTGGRIYGLVPCPVGWTDVYPSTIWADAGPVEFAQKSRRSPTGIIRRLERKLFGRVIW
jgi:GR25 family glycosyltransferase involved in LPS biosynthesis